MPRKHWSELPTEDLLDLRLCDLDLTIDDTWVEPLTQRVKEEIAARGLRVRPYFWLSDEWFCPKGIPGVAIPFYLAHPRLIRLERQQMLEVEGGTKRGCLRLLRHEVGHAVQNAYGLGRRRRFQELFGRTTDPYPHAYLPDPASRDYVLHLNGWYAQSHPDEDFAETFATWLGRRSVWRERYREWPGAFEKLQYVDELMQELEGAAPKNKRRARPESLPSLTQTLRSHYRKKRDRYSRDPALDQYDRDLERLFEVDDGSSRGESAAAFLRRNQTELRQLVSRWTGELPYALDEVLSEIRHRCRQRKLRAIRPSRALLLDFAIMLTVQTTLRLYVHREWRVV